MKSEKGQSLVEFALVLPVLLLLLFGIVDFGRAFHAYLTIDHVGRDAARTASIGKIDDASIVTTAKNNIMSVSGINSVDVTVSPSKASRTSGDEVTITIKNAKFTLLTPILGSLVKEITFKEDKTIMRVE
jgi:Flp pilus assembly protein TadG